MEPGAQLAAAVAAATVVVVGGFVLLRRRSRESSPQRRGDRRSPVHDADDLLHPRDLAELDALLWQADHEERAAHDSLLRSRLDLLVSRGVPVRRITAAPAPGAVTVGFADGTAITVRSRRAAESGVLLMYASQQRLLLRDYRQEDEWLLLRFRRTGRRGDVEVVALGLDQPA